MYIFKDTMRFLRHKGCRQTIKEMLFCQREQISRSDQRNTSERKNILKLIFAREDVDKVDIFLSVFLPLFYFFLSSQQRETLFATKRCSCCGDVVAFKVESGCLNSSMCFHSTPLYRNLSIFPGFLPSFSQTHTTVPRAPSAVSLKRHMALLRVTDLFLCGFE